MDKISVIVSCYNEEESLPLFYKEMERVREKDFKDVDFEYIFVDDGSKDKTLEEIKELKNKDEKVKFISFSRNFGKEAAMLAGLEAANGDYITLMDADLQDPPALLRQMYDLIKNEGYDCIGTRRVTRKGEPPIRSFFARVFYKLINKMSDIEMVDGARDYRLMTKQMVKAIISLKEYNRYSKGLYSFVGFKTKWSFWKLLKYAIDGITAFSTTPLILCSVIGIVFCLISFLMIIVIISRTLMFGDPTSGWPSLVCIIFLVSGIQLFSLGIVGQYLSKTYLEVKQRPIYIIRETNINEL